MATFFQVQAILISLIFFTLSVIHLYWLLGGKWAIEAALPDKENGEKLFYPSKKSTLIVALGLLFFGVFCLVYGRVINFDLPVWLRESMISVIIGIFLLRAIGDFRYVGLFRKIKGTQFADKDSRYFTPLCLLIFALALVMMISSDFI